MKKYLLQAVAVVGVFAVVLAFAVPSFAVEGPAKAEAPKAKPEAPKTKPFTGEVTAVDASSITLKNAKGETKTLKLGAECKQKAADLKVGAKVVANFTEDGVCVKLGAPKEMEPKKEPKKEGAAK